jgi:hypothetical protein
MSVDLLPFTSATLSVAGGPAAAIGTGTTSFVLAADKPVVLATTRQGVAKNYHFRCVPTDFPRLEVLRPGNPSAGWYLTTSGFAATPQQAVRNGPFLMILDHYGAPVWYKRTPSAMMDAKKLFDGRLAFTPSFGAYGIREDQGYWLTNLQGTGTIKHRTTDPAPSKLPTDHHDYAFTAVPGEQSFRTMVSYPIVANVDLSTMTGGLGTVDDTIADGVLEEVRDDGTRRWIWTMSDHFAAADSTFPINFGVAPDLIPGFPDAWDVFHINGIDREDDGDYVVTVRHMDGVFRVNRNADAVHAEGQVEWTFGTPPSTDGAKVLTVVGDPLGGPKRPHDARLNGDVLTMLDNRANTGQPPRAVAYRIDVAAGTATMLWEFRNPTPGGSTLGSTQQTADSVVVNWGAGQQPFLEEFAPNGTRLMAVGLPFGGNSYRTVKYPVGDFDVNQLRATAGGSVTPP